MIRVDIESENLMRVLTGRHAVAPGQEVWCEGMAVAKLAKDVLLVACAHPRHGMHPRYSDLATQIALLRYGALASVTCPVCDDAEWLPADSEPARRQLMLAHAVGYFRGVAIPECHKKRLRRPAAGATEEGSPSSPKSFFQADPANG